MSIMIINPNLLTITYNIVYVYIKSLSDLVNYNTLFLIYYFKQLSNSC